MLYDFKTRKVGEPDPISGNYMYGSSATAFFLIRFDEVEFAKLRLMEIDVPKVLVNAYKNGDIILRKIYVTIRGRGDKNFEMEQAKSKLTEFANRKEPVEVKYANFKDQFFDKNYEFIIIKKHDSDMLVEKRNGILIVYSPEDLVLTPLSSQQK